MANSSSDRRQRIHALVLALLAQQNDLEQRRQEYDAQRAADAAAKIQAREAAKAAAGYTKMMKDAGAVTEMGADGKESVKYDANGKWVAGAPADTETVALNYRRGNWSVGASANRIGQMYGDDSAKNNEAFVIDPYVVANLYANYTMKNTGVFGKALKLQFGVNNLFDNHSIVGIATASAGSNSVTPKASDLLTVNAARSFQLTATVDF
jgi:outer membrane receptor protein involved in Fe transport